MTEAEHRTTILFASAANLVFARAKLAGVLATSSKALLAEAAHSTADSCARERPHGARRATPR